MEHRLDCCVVRDLLPTYIEELTGPETTAQVARHLKDCPHCRQVETDMRTQIPVEPVSKRALGFLKRVKRTRLLAAALSALVALWCMWWIYDQEFHYENTSAGQLAAVSDYIATDIGNSRASEVHKDTPLRAIASAEEGNRLFIFYGAENGDNVHGVIRLVRGINGKYRPIKASKDPFPYTAGVYCEGIGDGYLMIGGDNCREIYAAEISYLIWDWTTDETSVVKQVYELPEMNFLWVQEETQAVQALGLEGIESAISVHVETIRLLDGDGNDITSQYQTDIEANWGGGISTAELGMVYVLMGIVGILGAIFIRYFLHPD